MLLSIKDKTIFIHGPIEVNCELGDASDWLMNGKKMGGAFSVGDNAGDTEVTIEP
jgi:hypothetical protein